MSAAASGAELLTPAELRRLERLRIRRRRAVRGDTRGEWRSRGFGSSGLFADHRPYVLGDDPRYVDWNVYGRLGDLVVKRFEAEESATLLLCLDRSPSMSGRKALAARRLAGALAWLALAHLDQVRLSWLPSTGRRAFTAWRSRAHAAALLDELATTPDAGTTDHVRDLGRIVGAVRRRGLAVLVSDFFDPAGAIRGLSLLRSHGMEVQAIHVLDPADAELPAGTSLRLEDRETGEQRVLEVTSALRERIRENWRRRIHGVERWCLGREIPHLRLDARRSLWDVLHDLLRARSAVRS